MIVNTSLSATPAGLAPKTCRNCQERGEWPGPICPSCRTDLELERQFRHVLLHLELVSHGACQAWNSDGRGGQDHVLPPGELDPPHIRHRRYWDRQVSDDGRRLVLKIASDELASITRRTTTIVSLSDREILTRNVLDCKGELDTDAAVRCRCTIKQVREIRVRNDLTADRGERIIGGNRAEWAAKLKSQGLTETAIAERMGVSQPTVNRLLKARRLRVAAA